MNVFRLAGDMTHLMSIIVLLLKIHATKSCAGVSLKTQELYLVVFLTRYLDLFTSFYSLYNSVMKLVFILSSVGVVELMWTFSIYLESVAILPQLVLLQRVQNVDNLSGNYIFLLGSYRGLYILNWIYRYFTEPRYLDYIKWVAGIVQTAIYGDFFYYYIKSWKNNER